MNNSEMTRAILHLDPAAEFSLSGDDLENIQWFSPGRRPTLTQIEAAWNEIKDWPEPEPEPDTRTPLKKRAEQTGE